MANSDATTNPPSGHTPGVPTPTVPFGFTGNSSGEVIYEFEDTFIALPRAMGGLIPNGTTYSFLSTLPVGLSYDVERHAIVGCLDLDGDPDRTVYRLTFHAENGK